MSRIAAARRTAAFVPMGRAIAALALGIGVFIASPAPAAADIITVDSAADTIANDGVCTLREAILVANPPNTAANGCVRTPAAGDDQIQFNIAGAGAHTINVTGSELPAITEGLVINGYSETGASLNTDPTLDNKVLTIELRGNSAGANANGLTVNIPVVAPPAAQPEAHISGLAIGGFSGSGIFVQSGKATILGNRIGADGTGTNSRFNGLGVRIADATNSVVGSSAPADRNQLSNSGGSGVSIEGPGTLTVVEGNVIANNAADGVQIVGGSFHRIGGIAGANLSAGCTGGCNRISNNGDHGINIMTGATSSNIIVANYIGAHASGLVADANAGGGVQIYNSQSNRIGDGLVPNSGNLISGNTEFGVAILGGFSDGNSIQSNLIGVQRTGASALANGDLGIVLYDDARNTLIGGTTGVTPGGACTGACNVISGAAQYGVRIHDGSTGAVVQGNHVGVSASGLAAVGNGIAGLGVFVSGNTIGGTTPEARNVISANGTYGIEIHVSSGAAGPVQGNYVGPDTLGTSVPGTQRHGISLVGAHNSPVIGGAAAGAGNLVSGNTDNGIVVSTSGAQVLGNLVGTDKNGTARLPNGTGIQVTAANVVIGGAQAGARNVVSGNDGSGIRIAGNGATGAQVLGNIVGLGLTGATVLNSDDGILVEQASLVVIGGANAGAGNTISGNDGNGIRAINAPTTSILGNLIGTTPDGQTARGNQSSGIRLENTSDAVIGAAGANARNTIADNGANGITLVGGSRNQVVGNTIGTPTGTSVRGNNGNGVALLGATETMVGGLGNGAGNTIAGNGAHGVLVTGNTAIRNGILGNSMVGNVGLGIDLGDDGVSPNDANDADTGPNNRQNTPVITRALFTNGPGATIQGTVTGLPASTNRIELFSNTAADPTAFGEGQTFLMSVNVTLDAGGSGQFSATSPVHLPQGTIITATTTDFLNNTSEFSQGRAVAAENCSPRPNINVTTTKAGNGRLQVTVTAGEAPGSPGNRLTRLEFQPGANILVDTPQQAGRTGAFTVQMPERPASYVFHVRQANAGQAGQLPFTVYDDCGAWPTFVGGGAGAF